MLRPSSTVQLVNNTNYFNPATSKLVNTFLNPSTFRFKQSKQEGIETRLYYEFEHVRKLGGQTFFYTLTYTDDKIPRFEGVPCFDYNHPPVKRIFATVRQTFISRLPGLRQGSI